MKVPIPRLLHRAGRAALSPRHRSDFSYEWRRRLGREPALPPDVQRVLVVCHGNLCRSPFAAALLRDRLPEVEVRSAGLHAASGHEAAPDAVTAAARLGVALEGHRTRPVDTSDVQRADLILAMEGHQVAEIARRWARARPKVRILGDYLPDPPHAIPDPWSQPEDVFNHTFQRIRIAAERVAALIRGAG